MNFFIYLKKEGKGECEKRRNWRGEEERQNKGMKAGRRNKMLNRKRGRKSNRCAKRINTGLVSSVSVDDRLVEKTPVTPYHQASEAPVQWVIVNKT